MLANGAAKMRWRAMPIILAARRPWCLVAAVVAG
jgi:hypothetical protein